MEWAGRRPPLTRNKGDGGAQRASAHLHNGCRNGGKEGQLSRVSTLKQGKDQKSSLRILMSEKEGPLEINEFKLDFSWWKTCRRGAAVPEGHTDN